MTRELRRDAGAIARGTQDERVRLIISGVVSGKAEFGKVGDQVVLMYELDGDKVFSAILAEDVDYMLEKGYVVPDGGVN